MLVSVLPVPFADAARQRQYDAALAALQAEADESATVLLGNLGAFSSIEADILLVRPNSLALGILTPRSGQLTIPALHYGTWQLAGQTLPGRLDGDNPFAQYQHQMPLALTWLSEHLGLPEAELPPCAGFALFEAPLTFGPEVEAQLHHHAAAHDFQLVGDAMQLPARLRQQPATEPAALSADELLKWGEHLANEPYVSHNDGVPESLSEGLATFLEQKLRQLWRWLGAEDIPADPPYGGAPPDQHLRDQQEQARLQQLRQELQAELHQQRQEAATREAARTQELALLRQQLTQAGPSATERQAEQRAKEALEESLRTARAELATRNQELDTRIQQLGQLLEELRAAPVVAPAVPSAVPAGGKRRPAAAPTWSFRRLRQVERWGLMLLAWAGVGAGTWGVVRWVQHTFPQPTTAVSRGGRPEHTPTDDDQTAQDPDTDSLARMQAEAVDTVARSFAQPEPTASEAATSSEADTSPVEQHADSSAAVAKPSKPVPASDSTAASPSPAP